MVWDENSENSKLICGVDAGVRRNVMCREEDALEVVRRRRDLEVVVGANKMGTCSVAGRAVPNTIAWGTVHKDLGNSHARKVLPRERGS